MNDEILLLQPNSPTNVVNVGLLSSRHVQIFSNFDKNSTNATDVMVGSTVMHDWPPKVALCKLIHSLYRFITFLCFLI